jgi:hypothetical protein
MASALEKALAAQYAGNGPMFMPSTPVKDLYAGIYGPRAPTSMPIQPNMPNMSAGAVARPRSTALSPQNYASAPPPHIPGDPRRLASGQLPFINAPIDITVRGGAPVQTASVPMPQPRPWNAPTSMDLAAIAAQNAPAMTAMGYAPQPVPRPAVAAATAAGQPPQTSWIQDLLAGIGTLRQPSAPASYNSPRDMSRAQMYAATNAASAEAARTRDRSGIGTDGYVRDTLGKVIGRSAEFKGQTPSQQYNTVNSNARAKASQKIGGSSSSGSSSGNLGGVSSSGRRYDYDNNKWV